MKTRDRILQNAVELFNCTNTQKATTNHISKKMGISPGNLHYYFKNREEIIREIYFKMKNEFTLLPHEFPNTLDELFKANRKSFKIQWKYRFFYSELLFLLSRDIELKSIYTKDILVQKKRYRLIFKQLEKKNVLIFKNDREIDYLVDMILLIEQFWNSYLKVYDDEEPNIDLVIYQIEKTITPFIVELS